MLAQLYLLAMARKVRTTTLVWLVISLLVGCDDQHGATLLQGVIEFEERTLSFEVAGRITWIKVKQGTWLKTSEEIAKLDDTIAKLEFQRTLAEARAQTAQLDLLYAGTRTEEIRILRAQLKAAKSQTEQEQIELNRTRTLFTSGSVPRSELDAHQNASTTAMSHQDELDQKLQQAVRGPRSQDIQRMEALAESAEKAAKVAAERLAKHTLVADSNFEVLDDPVKFGEYVQPGTPVVIVADTTHPYVDVFVPQAQIQKVSIEMPVSVKIDAYDQAFEGKVESIARATEFTPRFLFSPRERPNLVLRARVRVRNDNNRIRAGVPAFISLIESKKHK